MVLELTGTETRRVGYAQEWIRNLGLADANYYI